MSIGTVIIVWCGIALLAGCLVVAIFREDRGEELARDSDAEDLWRQVQSIRVHGGLHSYYDGGTSCGKADDISGGAQS